MDKSSKHCLRYFLHGEFLAFVNKSPWYIKAVIIAKRNPPTLPLVVAPAESWLKERGGPAFVIDVLGAFIILRYLKNQARPATRIMGPSVS
jgi:hypothetical protein